ncbi:hypothetical protein JNUCC1_00095 [Lentibacillus sp. JNUCC-1]|nr:FbpB family small basic protein [Lentibacillus sp. JNUCC-1]MUV36294.1 hypothetical protein [Lentibacillus sp. JNUCC-1]
MHPKHLTFEELVEENKNALMRDDKELDKLEIRLEKRQEEYMKEQ